jgi:PAS domain-containing protein
MEYKDFFHNRDELFKTFLENTRDLLFISCLGEPEIKIVYTNETAKNKLGYSLAEMNELGIDSFRKSIYDSISFPKYIEELKSEGSKTNYAIFTSKDKIEFSVEINSKIVTHNNIIYNRLLA